jgi:hypothetical protein
LGRGQTAKPWDLERERERESYYLSLYPKRVQTFLLMNSAGLNILEIKPDPANVQITPFLQNDGIAEVY